jgi:cytochrome c oxidase assembly protein subunit 11
MVKSHRRVAAYCLMGVATMAGAAYAAVPLYKLYCQVTGFGGTTQRAEKPADVVLDKTIKVRFDANTAPSLPWTFEPVQRTLDVKIGESTLAFYRATNNSGKPVKGTAMFNVTPEAAGIHFNKIECFCFQEQTLAPGESVEMPLTFFVDPKLVTDEDAQHITSITLSYAFFPVDEPGKTSAKAPEGVSEDKQVN